MSLQSVHQVFNMMTSKIPGIHLSGVSYYLAFAGIAILITFAIAGLVIVIAKGLRATWNMTPSGFLKLLLALGIALVIVGIVVP
ncbi:MAG: hypothetical protein G5Z42_02505 [Caldisphaeraceae archaeon]|nr:hypothetical protein [Caldisphaeraceae archaeon]MEB3691707.1 hypothetical protein [Caldisphaeraceae archaeon]MEB3797678.1 hypothetical protein [Caldisphaeraceae archaeon]